MSRVWLFVTLLFLLSGAFAQDLIAVPERRMAMQPRTRGLRGPRGNSVSTLAARGTLHDATAVRHAWDAQTPTQPSYNCIREKYVPTL